MNYKKQTYEDILQTIHKTNANLTKYQEQSYMFHLQHNENIKKIMGGLTTIYDYLKRKKVAQLTKKEENLFKTPPTISEEMNLHQKVMKCVKKNRKNEIKDILMGLKSVSLIESLQSESMQAILPTLSGFLLSNNDDKRGYGIGYLLEIYERKIALDAFGSGKVKSQVEQMIEGVKGIGGDIDNFEVKKEELIKVYNFLNGCVKN